MPLHGVRPDHSKHNKAILYVCMLYDIFFLSNKTRENCEFVFMIMDGKMGERRKLYAFSWEMGMREEIVHTIHI